MSTYEFKVTDRVRVRDGVFTAGDGLPKGALGTVVGLGIQACLVDVDNKGEWVLDPHEIELVETS